MGFSIPVLSMAALPSGVAHAAGCNASAVSSLLAYVAGKPTGSGLVVHGGTKCASWGNISQKYDIKSATKSIGSMLVGLAIEDGKITLDTKVGSDVAPILKVPAGNAAWPGQVTYRQLATHTAGFTKAGDTGKIMFQPGTKWAYSDGGANWIADGLTSVYRQDLKELIYSRVFSKIGIGRGDYSWRPNAYRPQTLNGVPRREFGAGVSITPAAMAKIGGLFLDGGKGLIDGGFAAAAGKPQPKTTGLPAAVAAYAKTGAPRHYGVLWWTNGDGTIKNLPKDAYWAWGLGEALILVVPSLDLVAARAGNAWQHGWLPSYGVVGPFFQKVAAVAR